MSEVTYRCIAFHVIYLSGFTLLWWQTNWKVLAAMVLIGWGLLQAKGWPENPR